MKILPVLLFDRYEMLFITSAINQFTFSDFFISAVIIISYSAKRPIPYQKIQAVVSCEMFVMKIMGGTRTDPSAYPCFVEVFGKQFITQMTINIVNKLE